MSIEEKVTKDIGNNSSSSLDEFQFHPGGGRFPEKGEHNNAGRTKDFSPVKLGSRE